MPFLYTVQIGDSLDYIAQRFGTTLPKLLQVNSICYPYFIYIGQRLIIPIDKNINSINVDIPFSPLSGTNYTTANGHLAPMTSPIDQSSFEKFLGKKGTMQDGVLKFTFPRYDLKVYL